MNQVSSQDDVYSSRGQHRKNSMTRLLHTLLMTLLCQRMYQARSIHLTAVYSSVYIMQEPYDIERCGMAAAHEIWTCRMKSVCKGS